MSNVSSSAPSDPPADPSSSGSASGAAQSTNAPGGADSGSSAGVPSGPIAATPLTRAVLEIDEYASGLGWDQPARLFALVDTTKLRVQEPGLAAQLGLDGDEAAAPLTPVEQEEIPAGKPLDEFLATIAWPDAVAGCALTVERQMLPTSAEAAVPQGLDDASLAQWVAAHPDRQEVRMTVAVLRDGTRESALRLRDKDSSREVLTGSDLVPGLAEALSATFEA
ncbi:PPA1309 family protein [Streptomyces sp. NBC_00690]|uniref:PPA1309 family protein n=1 Tax=Streptomyces sp. NBC_00690 TaxID=2975808 RepID=UPI002E2D6F76|nr:PPA1309 family protein [Streptomyces sp. NBC_00690]